MQFTLGFWAWHHHNRQVLYDLDAYFWALDASYYGTDWGVAWRNPLKLLCNSGDMEPVKFSIITISYNHAEFIEDTIRSVQAQSYQNIEHIVIDGGSKDHTVEILKKYPHLNWVSEPDRGISHALNKGLQKATGDVVAWINADDWYEPNIFHKVAKEFLAGNHIIMGNAVETDRAGTPVRTLKNHPRTLYDIQKYWVPLAWFAQPSIFFSRAALEAVKLPNGDFIDESYSYSMDFDLWLRFAEHFPFTCSVDEVFSYFRIYGENATGRTFASPQRELGRAFRRSAHAMVREERPLSIIVPVESLQSDLASTLTSVFEQTQKGFDVILVDGTTSAEERKAIKDAVLELEEATTEIGFRLIKKPGAPFNELVQAGIEAVRSSLFVVIQPGDAPSASFVSELNSLFSHDVYGVALFLKKDHPTYQTVIDQKTELINPHTLLGVEDTFLPFAARTMIAGEIGSYNDGINSFASFLIRAFNRGWLLTNRPEVNFSKDGPSRNPSPYNQKLLAQYAKADLFLRAASDIADDIFYPIRSQSGYTLIYQPEQVQRVKEFFKVVPENWAELSNTSPIGELEACVKNFPLFAPAWSYLFDQYTKEGRMDAAKAAQERLFQLRPELR